MIEGQMARQVIAASDVLRVVMHRIALLVCWSLLRVVECVSVDGTGSWFCTHRVELRFFNFMFRTILIMINHSIVVWFAMPSKKFGRARMSQPFGVTELMIGSNGNTTGSSILEERLKSLKPVNVIWWSFSRIGRRVIFRIWDWSGWATWWLSLWPIRNCMNIMWLQTEIFFTKWGEGLFDVLSRVCMTNGSRLKC